MLLQDFTWVPRAKVCAQLGEGLAHPGCLWGEARARREKSLQSELRGGYR